MKSGEVECDMVPTIVEAEQVGCKERLLLSVVLGEEEDRSI